MAIRDDRMSKTELARLTPEYIACLDELLGAVDHDDDVEYNVLRQLVHRAGAGWVCANPSCRGINNHVDNRCCGCDGRKPRPRAVPQPETVADYHERMAYKANNARKGEENA